jgi:hypothetical protein
MNAYKRKIVSLVAVGIVGAVTYFIANSNPAVAQTERGGPTFSVEATQSGQWNVGITGIVEVKNIDERGRAPYTERLQCQSSTTNVCFASGLAVPAGKRLVIEHISASIRTASGPLTQAPFQVELFTGAGNPLGYFPYQTVAKGNPNIYVVNESVIAYC